MTSTKPSSPEKSPTKQEKSPTKQEKSPTKREKSPTKQEKSPTKKPLESDSICRIHGLSGAKYLNSQLGVVRRLDTDTNRYILELVGDCRFILENENFYKNNKSNDKSNNNSLNTINETNVQEGEHTTDNINPQSVTSTDSRKCDGTGQYSIDLLSYFPLQPILVKRENLQFLKILDRSNPENGGLLDIIMKDALIALADNDIPVCVIPSGRFYDGDEKYKKNDKILKNLDLLTNTWKTTRENNEEVLDAIKNGSQFHLERPMVLVGHGTGDSRVSILGDQGNTTFDFRYINLNINTSNDIIEMDEKDELSSSSSSTIIRNESKSSTWSSSANSSSSSYDSQGNKKPTSSLSRTKISPLSADISTRLKFLCKNITFKGYTRVSGCRLSEFRFEKVRFDASGYVAANKPDMLREEHDYGKEAVSLQKCCNKFLGLKWKESGESLDLIGDVHVGGAPASGGTGTNTGLSKGYLPRKDIYKNHMGYEVGYKGLIVFDKCKIIGGTDGVNVNYGSISSNKIKSSDREIISTEKLKSIFSSAGSMRCYFKSCEILKASSKGMFLFNDAIVEDTRIEMCGSYGVKTRACLIKKGNTNVIQNGIWDYQPWQRLEDFDLNEVGGGLGKSVEPGSDDFGHDFQNVNEEDLKGDTDKEDKDDLMSSHTGFGMSGMASARGKIGDRVEYGPYGPESARGSSSSTGTKRLPSMGDLRSDTERQLNALLRKMGMGGGSKGGGGGRGGNFDDDESSDEEDEEVLFADRIYLRFDGVSETKNLHWLKWNGLANKLHPPSEECPLGVYGDIGAWNRLSKEKRDMLKRGEHIIREKKVEKGKEYKIDPTDFIETEEEEEEEGGELETESEVEAEPKKHSVKESIIEEEEEDEESGDEIDAEPEESNHIKEKFKERKKEKDKDIKEKSKKEKEGKHNKENIKKNKKENIKKKKEITKEDERKIEARKKLEEMEERIISKTTAKDEVDELIRSFYSDYTFN